MKLLIIDDEPAIRRSLRRAAERGQHSVLEAENGEEGLSIWRKEDPDLVFLDVLMPGLSGPEVLSEVGQNRKAKVILISAYTGEYNTEKAEALGADLFISKPFSDIFGVIQSAEDLVNG